MKVEIGKLIRDLQLNKYTKCTSAINFGLGRYAIQFEHDNVKLGNQRHLKLTTGQLFQEVSGMKFIVFVTGT